MLNMLKRILKQMLKQMLKPTRLNQQHQPNMAAEHEVLELCALNVAESTRIQMVRLSVLDSVRWFTQFANSICRFNSPIHLIHLIQFVNSLDLIPQFI